MLLRGLITALALVVVAAFAVADETEAEKPGKDWSDHMGELPFIVGHDKGMAEVEFSGKPPMFFFTTTW